MKTGHGQCLAIVGEQIAIPLIDKVVSVNACLRQLVSESRDDYADDGSAHGPHANDWRVRLGDNGIWDAQQESKE